MLLLAFLACAAGDAPTKGTDAAPIGYYEAGWPIDACSADFPAEGTGHGIGDVLPQYEFVAQSGETARLHDWCNHVVYIEIGYFT